MTLRKAVYRYKGLLNFWIVMEWQPNQQGYLRTKYVGYWRSLWAVLYKRFLLWPNNNYRVWR